MKKALYEHLFIITSDFICPFTKPVAAGVRRLGSRYYDWTLLILDSCTASSPEVMIFQLQQTLGEQMFRPIRSADVTVLKLKSFIRSHIFVN